MDPKDVIHYLLEDLAMAIFIMNIHVCCYVNNDL